jgi:hypothetical protein
MRTTVTLDRDVERGLREAMHRSRKSFKETLNNAIRLGLSTGGRRKPTPAFKLKTRPMKLRAGIDPARLNQLADELEVEAFLEKSRRLHDHS